MVEASAYPGFVSPVTARARFLRIDQGVDWDSPDTVRAVGDGHIVRVAPPGSIAGGTGQIVVQQLARPVTVNGHTYDQVYYSERTPLVQVPQQVAPGSPVMAAGSNEIGFARNGRVAAPLVGGLGAGTKATIEGRDFYDFVLALQHPPATVPTPTPGTGRRFRQYHAPGAWKQLTRALGHDLAGSLYTTQRVRHALHRRVR